MKMVCLIILILCSSVFSKSPESDKEYVEIFNLIEDDNITDAISKLKAYHSKGKKQKHSHLLLAKLYSMNEDYKNALKTLYNLDEDEKNPTYWGVLIKTMNLSYKKNKNKESDQNINYAINGYLTENRNLSSQGQALLDFTFSYYKNKELKEKYCSLLLKETKNVCK